MYRSLLVASFAVLTANVFGMDPGYHGESSNSSNCSLLREVKQEHFGENSVESSGENVQNNRIDQNNLISSLLKVLSENDTFKSEIQDKNAEIQKITKEKDSKIRELRDKFKRAYSAMAGLCGQLMESETRAYSAMTDLYEQLMESENREKNLKQRLIKANNDVFNKFYEKHTLKRSRSAGEEEIQRELNSNKLRHVISKNNETIAEYKNKKEALEAKNQELKTILNDTATELEKIQNLQAENENTHRKKKEALVIEIQKLQKENQKKDKAITDFQNKEDILKRKLDKADQEINTLKKQYSLKVFEERELDTIKYPIDLSKYGSFPNLEYLTIESDKLSSILQNKPNLSEVKHLRIIANRDPLDPAKLANLLSLTKNVEILDISGTQLISLPKEIGNLPYLTYLYLYNNNLKELPKEIGNAKNLIRLSLSGNPLTTLPEGINNLSLKKLWLSDTDIPMAYISKLKEKKNLDIYL